MKDIREEVEIAIGIVLAIIALLALLYYINFDISRILEIFTYYSKQHHLEMTTY